MSMTIQEAEDLARIVLASPHMRADDDNGSVHIYIRSDMERIPDDELETLIRGTKRKIHIHNPRTSGMTGFMLDKKTVRRLLAEARA